MALPAADVPPQFESPLLDVQRVLSLLDKFLLDCTQVFPGNNQHERDFVRSLRDARWQGRVAQLHEMMRNTREERIGFYGVTGAGKSTLINTIVGQRILPEGGSQKSCTAVACELARCDCPLYHVLVRYVSQAEWVPSCARYASIVLEELVAHSGVGDSECKRARAAAPSPKEAASQYREALEAVYGPLTPEDLSQLAASSFEQPQAVNEILRLDGNQRWVSFEEPEQVADFLRATVASTQRVPVITRKSGRTPSLTPSPPPVARQAFWPLVRSAAVYGPFDNLPLGVRLVDLPGCNDDNEFRAHEGERIKASCSKVWLVAKIQDKFGSNKETKRMLEQLLADGLLQRGRTRVVFTQCEQRDQPPDQEQTILDVEERVSVITGKLGVTTEKTVPEVSFTATSLRRAYTNKNELAVEAFEARGFEKEDTGMDELASVLSSCGLHRSKHTHTHTHTHI
eukprot:TRINITY_DN1398_c0_g1_i4.p1 TRINITY_DN1398_c0_g1~~TRINITY_DN1398_c0_g1_i4.p1  ORF type:complete len:475 (-),score=91.95 TRINITY_DN1398_c0_g1_i4:1433-2800(-)